MELGSVYNVTVEKFVKSGAIVRLEDGSTQLIHVSKISSHYVKNIEDFLEIGETYQATCVEGKNKPLELSLVPLNLKSRIVKEHSKVERKPSYVNDSNKPNRYKNQKSYHPSQEEYAGLKSSPEVYRPKRESTKDIDKMIERAQKDYQDKAKQMNSRNMGKRSGGYPALKRKH